MKNYWNRLDSQTRYKNAIISLREDLYHFSLNDITREFTVLEFGDWVNIIPITRDNHIVMIRQYRHGTMQETLEIPGGQISDPGEDPKDAALREMMEETGYFSEEIIHLGVVKPNPAIQNNRCHTFLAKNAYPKSAQDLDPTEAIRVELIKKQRVFDMIRSSDIDHGLVVAAFAFYMLHNGRSE